MTNKELRVIRFRGGPLDGRVEHPPEWHKQPNTSESFTEFWTTVETVAVEAPETEGVAVQPTYIAGRYWQTDSPDDTERLFVWHEDE